jgi:hypothetical protein
MVEMSLNGNLGNQLFMYAIARTAQLESGSEKICFNTSTLEAENCDNALLNYNLSECVEFFSKPIRTLSNSLHAPFYKNLLFMHYRKKAIGCNDNEIYEYEKRTEKFYSKFGFFLCNNKYRDLDFTNRKYILLHGYYQCDKFFEKHKDIILKDLTPKRPALTHNVSKIQTIKNCESVCVSLRLGEDYTKNEMYNVCTLKYFKNAIKYMKEHLNNPTFYVFSDVTEGLSEFFDNDSSMVFETGNDPSYEKLRVMSSCKHYIISNSSFSWWSQYLGDYEKKIVVSPDRWYNLGIETDIMMDSWVRLET